MEILLEQLWFELAFCFGLNGVRKSATTRTFSENL